MTFLRTATAAPSANDAFKLRYPKYLRRSLLAALALTALFVALWPGYEPLPYQLRQRETLELIEIAEPAPVVPPDVIPPPEVNWGPIEPVEGPGELPPVVVPPLLPTPPPAPTIQIGGDDFVASSSRPRLVARARADYPELARLSGLEGTVVVHVLVAPTGRVREVRVAQGVHPLLDEAAAAAARRCVFEPGTQRQVPVRAWVAIPFRFSLR